MPAVCAMLCNVVFYNCSVLLMSLRVASLTLGQSYDCPSASEVTLKDMGYGIKQVHQELMT